MSNAHNAVSKNRAVDGNSSRSASPEKHAIVLESCANAIGNEEVLGAGYAGPGIGVRVVVASDPQESRAYGPTPRRPASLRSVRCPPPWRGAYPGAETGRSGGRDAFFDGYPISL